MTASWSARDCGSTRRGLVSPQKGGRRQRGLQRRDWLATRRRTPLPALALPARTRPGTTATSERCLAAKTLRAGPAPRRPDRPHHRPRPARAPCPRSEGVDCVVKGRLSRLIHQRRRQATVSNAAERHVSVSHGPAAMLASWPTRKGAAEREQRPGLRVSIAAQQCTRRWRAMTSPSGRPWLRPNGWHSRGR